MELRLRRSASGETASLGLQPGDEPVDLDAAGFPAMTVELLPDCEEDDHDTYGDCDGEVRRREMARAGAYRKLPGESVWLCLNHARQAARRGYVQARS